MTCILTGIHAGAIESNNNILRYNSISKKVQAEGVGMYMKRECELGPKEKYVKIDLCKKK